MDAKDLMIGNFIIQKEILIDDYLSEDSKVIKVDSIYFDAIVRELYLVNGFPCNFYDPILITEDWLTEFNFTYFEEYDEWSETVDGSGFLICRCPESGDWLTESINISYVHELQNLFKMKRKFSLKLN